MICGKTLKDKITNEKVRGITGMDEMKEFLRGQRLSWLGHVERMDENRGPAKALPFQIDGSKKIPKKRWIEVLEKDMRERGLKRINAQDRDFWKLGCKNRLIFACRDDSPDSRTRKKSYHSGAKR